jgi:DtxR family transcriptional regulator, Mn-dependent transcriptional regulator
MKLGEAAQELLERLWIDIAEEKKAGLALNGSQPDGTDELIQNGLAERTATTLTLTPEGLPEAAQAVRRHRLAERLLADVLATEQGELDEQACRLEHALFEGLDESICTLLGHPTFCPHGKPIPQGECCRQLRASVERLIAPLCNLETGQGGHIAYVQMNNPNRMQKLMAMGVLPGVRVRLLRRYPSFVFEAGYSQFAVDEEIAMGIYVRLSRLSQS